MNNPVITTENAGLYFSSARRAKTLFTTDGYTLEVISLEKMLVSKPEYPFGTGGAENDGQYKVNAVVGTCDCPQFEKHGFCKHQIACQELYEEEIKWTLICNAVDAQAACEA